MSQFLEYPEIFDKPVRLDQEEREDPFQVMTDFFRDHHLHECRHQLWEMVNCCLTSDYPEWDESFERGALLQQYQDLERLLEAVLLVVQQKAAGSRCPG